MTPYPRPDVEHFYGVHRRLLDWSAKLLWLSLLLTAVGAVLMLTKTQAVKPVPAREDSREECGAAAAKMQLPMTYTEADGWCPPTPVAVFATAESAQAFSHGLHDTATTQIGTVVRLETYNQQRSDRWNRLRSDFIRQSCMAKGFLSYFDDDDGFEPHASATTIDPLHFEFNEMHWVNLGLNLTPVQASPAKPRTVAVIDQGTAVHPDLKVTARYKIVDASQASTDCIIGICCAVEPAAGGNTHANRVAGAIGATPYNKIGIRGIGSVDKLHSIKISRANASCMRRDDVVAGVKCASELKANVINMSIGTEKPTDQLGLLVRVHPGPGGLMIFEFAFDPQSRERALKEAIEKAGANTPPALVVASSGNDQCQLNQLGTRCYSWPGSLELDNVITAEARKKNGDVDSSNFSTTYVDLAVGLPRKDGVYCSTSSQPEPHYATDKCESGYANFSESSAAAAIVSGASTLVWKHPNYQNCTPTQLRHVLIEHGLPHTPIGPNNQPEPKKTACMLRLDFLATVESDRATELALDKCANHKPPLGCGKPAP